MRVGPSVVEVQPEWGMIGVDPHWSDAPSYESPVPLWLAPEIGRWVARESRGRGYHYDDESATGREIPEPSHRWKLVDWM